jgi:glycosyltransferase involved in cell wall biosynthesis
MMRRPWATIAIPLHNGADRLHIPLEGLVAQDTPTDLFEVLVVDNASTDESSRVANEHPAMTQMRERGISCRVVQEDRLGLIYARIRAVIEARGRYICFLDDDNGPEPNYVAEAVAAFESEPLAGIIIARVHPVFEAPPPPAVSRRRHLLAINDYAGDAEKCWGRGSLDGFLPTVGAGMCVRRQAFLEAIPWRQPEQLLSGRCGRRLTSGEDIELGYLIARAGWKCFYRPTLRVAHHLPATRHRVRYFCRLIVGVIRSDLTLHAKYLGLHHGAGRRASRLAKLLGAAAASPAIMLRPDGLREVLFALTYRWARLLGPFSDASRPIGPPLRPPEGNSGSLATSSPTP